MVLQVLELLQPNLDVMLKAGTVNTGGGGGGGGQNNPGQVRQYDQVW